MIRIHSRWRWVVACLLLILGCRDKQVTDLQPEYGVVPNSGKVVITPATVTIAPGETTELTGVVTNPAGKTVPNQQIAWTSSNDAVATVDARGRVTGVAEGTATITATAPPRTGTATITVAYRPTVLNVADIAARFGDNVTLSATLTSAGTPVPGHDVTFTVGGAAVGNAATDASGVARVTYTVTQSAGGPYEIGAQTPIAGFYAAAAGTGSLTVAQRPTNIVLSDASTAYGDDVTLSATLLSEGVPVLGKTVEFSVNGSVVGGAATGGDGVGKLTHRVTLAPGTYQLRARWNGDSQHATSEATSSLDVTKKTGTLAYTGDTGPLSSPTEPVTLSARLTPDGGAAFEAPAPDIRVRFTVSYDGTTIDTRESVLDGSGNTAVALPGLVAREPREYQVEVELLSNDYYTADGTATATIVGPPSDITIQSSWVAAGGQATIRTARAVIGSVIDLDFDANPGADATLRIAYSNGEIRLQIERAAGVSEPQSLLLAFQPDDAGFSPVRFTAHGLPAQSDARLMQLQIGGGVRYTWNATSALSFVSFEAVGQATNDNVAPFVAFATGARTPFTLDLPRTPNAQLAVSGGERLDKLEAAAGTTQLPSGVDDVIAYTDDATRLRLTNAKSVRIGFDPFTLDMQHEVAQNGGTRVLNLQAQYSDAGTPVTITGTLNKPSASTALALALKPDGAVGVVAQNASTVQSFSLNTQGASGWNTASLTLQNIPTKLQGCIAKDGQCRRTDRLPSALSNYAAFQNNPAQNATAGGQNRPYPATVSVNFDDFGTSGTSSLINSMVTLNATLGQSVGPTTRFTNVRFHQLAFDFGPHPTNPSFSYLIDNVPRVYGYFDSVALPFVMNEVVIPQYVTRFRVGTDANPANANRRLAWTPGLRCTSSIFGTCITTGIDTRTSGSFNCGGQREFVWRQPTDVNLLDFLGIQVLPLCS